MGISYRVCTSNEEYDAVQKLEIAIWNMPSADDAITAHMMHVVTHTGGIVMGAFDGERMIGLAVGLATKFPGRLWSHMAGVHPDYQGQGIGYDIKQFQREWALKQGYTEMCWTFDPAMRRNAHFNFHLLGASTNSYHANFYGVMKDGINAGVPSDRFEVVWQLEADKKSSHEIPSDIPFLLEIDEQQPVITENRSEPYYAVICPYDFPALKAKNLDLAVQWRQAMREVLQSAFNHGYHVVDFVTNRDTKKCWYVLHRH